jgi:ankyrin repeat protein
VGLDTDTLLHVASKEGQDEIVRLLLEWGADIEAFDQERRRPLHHAAMTGQKVIVKMLLEKGANVQVTDSSNSTPLHYAVEVDDIGTVRLLLDSKADIEAIDDKRRTALYRASGKGRNKIIRLLIQQDANLNRPPSTVPPKRIRDDVFTTNNNAARKRIKMQNSPTEDIAEQLVQEGTCFQ